MEENIIYRDRDPRFNGKVSILVAETEDALFEEFYKTWTKSVQKEWDYWNTWIDYQKHK